MPQTPPSPPRPRSPHLNSAMCVLIDACRQKISELSDLTAGLSHEWATAKNITYEVHGAFKCTHGLSSLRSYTHGLSSPRSPRSGPMLPTIGNHSDVFPGMELLIKSPEVSECNDGSRDFDMYGERVHGSLHTHAIDVIQLSKGSSRTNSQALDMIRRSALSEVEYEKLYHKEFLVKDAWLTNEEAHGLQVDLAARSVQNSKVHARQRADSNHSLDSDTDWHASRTMTSSSYASIVLDEHDYLWRRIVSSPAAPRRIAWEIVGLVSILYDLVVLPVAICFDMPKSTFTDSIDWFARVFWTLNVPVALTTGYIMKDSLVMSRKLIFRNYCKTWLIVDLLTVLPDWAFLVLSTLEDEADGGNAGSLVKTLRFLRLLRLARLMRLTKLRDAWHLIHDLIDSEKIGILLEVIKNILMLMVVTHYIACLWFAVGSAQEGANWVDFYKFTDLDVVWEHQFLAAYHSSITQFAASVDIYPRSAGERAFAIFVVIFGMIGFSYLVGSIASSLARLQALNEKKATDFWMLRKFLKQKQVPHELCLRIRCYAVNQWERQVTDLTSSSIESLNLLSENLKSDLKCAINAPSLAVHPLFYELNTHLKGTTRRLMLTGISELSLAPKDIMFTAGEKATHMSVLTSGTMHYDRMHLEKNYPEKLSSLEDWIAEPVLWVEGWIYLGDLRSKTASELLQIDPMKFTSIAKLNPLAFMLLCSYSQEYTRWLNSLKTETLSDITQGEDASCMLSDMIEKIAMSVPFRNLNKWEKPRSRRGSASSDASARAAAIAACELR